MTNRRSQAHRRKEVDGSLNHKTTSVASYLAKFYWSRIAIFMYNIPLLTASGRVRRRTE